MSDSEKQQAGAEAKQSRGGTERAKKTKLAKKDANAPKVGPQSQSGSR